MNTGIKPRIVAVRHLAFEDLGRLAGVCAARDIPVSYVEAGIDDIAAALESADIAIVLGGPIGVYEEARYPFLTAELAALTARLRAGRPTLGICLGAQLMAAAMGARVFAGDSKEIGWAPVILTEAGRSSPLGDIEGMPVLHWHGDTFDLPEGATLLAGSADYPHQAFSVGPNLLGLQFHMEVESERIEQWLIGHTGELAAAGIEPETLREQTIRLPAAVAAAGVRVFEAWLGQLKW